MPKHKECLGCSKKFKSPYTNKMYCTQECRLVSQRKNIEAGNELNERYDGFVYQGEGHLSRRGKICKGCNKFFKTHNMTRVWCTTDCRLETTRKETFIKRHGSIEERRKIQREAVARRSRRTSHPYFAYINIIKDQEIAIGIKFGVELKANSRHKNQNRISCFDITPHVSYGFEHRNLAFMAEHECKKTFECRIVSKADMPDGYTETTYCYNIEAIEAIYRKHGGVRI